MPHHSYVSDKSKHQVGPFPRKEAVASWEYIEVNQRDRIYHLVMDLDADDAILDWYDSRIPFFPSYFVGQRKKGRIVRPHAVIKLRIPVKTDSAKQMRLLQVLKNRIFDLLSEAGGPDGYNDRRMPPRTKNPRHRAWSVQVGDPREWTLYELRDALDLPALEDLDDEDRIVTRAKHSYYFDQDRADLGRNCNLFERLRGAVYAQKAVAHSMQDLHNFALDLARDLNDEHHADNPLPWRAVKATAWSVARWTWLHYTGSGAGMRTVDWGACSRYGLITDDMTMRQRQAVGGRYGATRNAIKTLERVKAMYQSLKETGRTLSLKEMAREFGLARNTIRKYRDFALAEIEKSTGIPLAAVIDRLKNQGVKTVHQESSPAKESSSEPDLRGLRNGQVAEFWFVPGEPDTYLDSFGYPNCRLEWDPFIVWRHSDGEAWDPPPEHALH